MQVQSQFLALVGSTLVCALSSAQNANRTYEYDALGNRIAATNQVRFSSAAAYSIAPRRATPGGRINISGRNFPAGDVAGVSVSFGGVVGNVFRVSSRVITVDVPTGTTSGAVVITLPDSTQIQAGVLTIESVSITPDVAPVFYGESIQFSATVVGTASQAVQWSVNDVVGGSAALGTISANGLYMAPINSTEVAFPSVIRAKSLELDVTDVAVLVPGCTSSSLLPLDQPTPGTIVSPSDRHCYTFSAPAGIPLVLACSGTPSVRMRIRDGSEILVDGRGPGGALSVFPFTSSGGETFELQIEAADQTMGDFTVGVLDVSDRTVAHWTNPGTGPWGSGLNWLGEAVPDPSASARVSLLGVGECVWNSATGGIHNLYCDEDFQFFSGTFDLTGSGEFLGSTTLLPSATILNTGNLAASGTLNLRGGTFTGPGITRATGSLLLDTNARSTVSGGHTFLHSGIGSWSGPGGLRIQGSAVFQILPGGLLALESDAGMDGGATNGVFINAGEFRKSAGLGVSQIGPRVSMMNEGVVQVDSGTLQLTGGGLHTGEFNIARNAQILITNTLFSFGAGATTAGDGFLRVVSNGDLEVEGASAAERLEIATGGTRSGVASLDVGSTLMWTGGSLTGAGLTVAQTSLDIRGAAQKNLGGNHVLRNEGLATVQDQGATRLQGGATLLNTPGAQFDFLSDADLAAVTMGGTFENQGTLSKSGGTGVTSVGTLAVLNSSGLIEAHSGTLEVRGGGVNSGQFDVLAGAQLDFASLPYEFAAGTVGTGDGFVRVLSSGEVVVTGGATLSRFEMAQTGTRSGPSQMNISDQMVWSGGTLTGPGLTITEGTMVFTGASRRELEGGHTFRNEGLASVVGAGSTRLAGGATLVNAAGALLDFQTDSDVQGVTAGGTFENQGTVVKSAGAFTSAVQSLVLFNNNGLVETQSGTFDVAGGGAGSGTFHVTTGALTFTGAPYVCLAGTAFTGAGSTQVLTNGELVVSGNSVAENLEIATGGERSGLADLTVTSNLIWSGGELSGAGRTLVSGDLDMAGASRKELTGGHAIINSGTARMIGAGAVRFAGGSLIENQLGATLDLQSDADFSSVSGGGTIENQGSIVKTAGGGSSLLGLEVQLNNDGSVNIETGQLSLTGGGSSTGLFHADAGAAVEFSAGTYFLDAGTNFTGPGPVGPINSGVLETIGSVSLQDLDIQVGGTLRGVATVTLTGSLDWLGGEMDQGGITLNQGTANLPGASAKSLSGGRVLRNEGTMILGGSGQLRIREGSRLENLAGGLIDVQSNLTITGAGAAGAFDNAGTFRRSVGTGQVSFSSQVPFSSSGTVELLAGAVNFGSVYTQTAGVTSLSGGGLVATTVDVQGGRVEGIGNILATVNSAGTLSPGADLVTGSLAVGNAYSQLSAGSLSIELASATDHDSLSVGQSVALDGTLNVTLLGGFVPAVGDSFAILTGSSITGTFATENLPAGNTWDVTYGASGVVLTVLP